MMDNCFKFSFSAILVEVKSPVAPVQHFECFCMSAVFSKQARFKFRNTFFIWILPVIALPHHQPAEMRTYRFQAFYDFKNNSSTVLSRESSLVTSFPFSSSILFVDRSQNVTMQVWQSSEAQTTESSNHKT